MAAAPSMENPRRLLHGFFSFELCKELEFIHRSSGTVGYRPSVFSTTLPHLAATNCGHFILPFLPLRDRLKDAVEETFGCEFELFVEFTGLISWCKGASIGWHSDDNKPYLRQRDFAAVCYLNNHEKDFRGGLFHFKDGEPSSVAPIAGDVLIYTADERNIHCVDEVIDGERLTLTLWFTRDCSHDEDAKVINILSQRIQYEPDSFLPLPASSTMYWFQKDGSGFDVRHARVSFLGYDFSSTKEKSRADNSLCDPLELLDGRLYLARGDEVLVKEFLNSLHALQVLQFCYWRASELAKGREEGHRQGSARPAILKRTSNLKLSLPHDDKLAVEVLGGPSCNCIKLQFKWEDLVLGIAKWEEYVSQLHRNMLVCIPSWLSNHTLSLDNHIVEFVHAT
ncbi:uncharacterized protein LOC122015347 isoform X1 [Zingiber officinale]|uniref:procollagen-proline 3-dioxygenase n=1 Tax=Zingiber officinale TaxID=94328 RepID=A0A8J5KM13_ZINOF|nr:uncharacterized protein LOC122015347 isoform X1 [Zingiber officinale]KAG6481863.1 hypothetical protein ZIOFF_058486 [Zingiber officinale]